MWYEGSGTSDRRFLMADERGSIVSISDSTGAIININAHDEYGIPAPGNAGRFGYTGQIWLPELKLCYYKARMYSPTLGRFLQTDSIGYGDGMNWYNYVGGDPVNFVDPLGLEADCTGNPPPPGCEIIVEGKPKPKKKKENDDGSAGFCEDNPWMCVRFPPPPAPCYIPMKCDPGATPQPKKPLPPPPPKPKPKPGRLQQCIDNAAKNIVEGKELNDFDANDVADVSSPLHPHNRAVQNYGFAMTQALPYKMLKDIGEYVGRSCPAKQ